MPEEQQTPEQPPAGEAFQPIASQDELNRIIGDRLARERSRFADYNDLKTKANKFDELEAANATEAEKATKALNDVTRALEAANQRTLNAEARALAAAAKFRNPVLAVRAIDLGDVKVGDDGTVDAAAIKSRLQELAAADPYLVDDGTVTPGRPKPDDAQGQGGGKPDRAAEGVAEARKRFGPKAGAQQ